MCKCFTAETECKRPDLCWTCWLQWPLSLCSVNGQFSPHLVLSCKIDETYFSWNFISLIYYLWGLCSLALQICAAIFLSVIIPFLSPWCSCLLSTVKAVLQSRKNIEGAGKKRPRILLKTEVKLVPRRCTSGNNVCVQPLFTLLSHDLLWNRDGKEASVRSSEC